MIKAMYIVQLTNSRYIWMEMTISAMSCIFSAKCYVLRQGVVALIDQFFA